MRNQESIAIQPQTTGYALGQEFTQLATVPTQPLCLIYVTYLSQQAFDFFNL